MHTAETSSCGKVPAAEALKAFKDNGYDLVCVTDHFNERYYNYYETLLPAGLDEGEKWRRSTDIWFAGRRAALAAARETGVTVIPGAEIQLSGHTCEFLVYGLQEEVFYDCRGLYKLSVDEFSRIVRSYGAFMALAHPFRHDDRPDTSLYEGAEIFNRSESFRGDGTRDDTHNDLAREFARGHGLIPLCGQDYHEYDQMRGIKTRFHGKIADAADMISLLREREFDLMLPDDEILPAKDF